MYSEESSHNVIWLLIVCSFHEQTDIFSLHLQISILLYSIFNLKVKTLGNSIGKSSNIYEVTLR
jgi:hypothetical protein